MSEELLRRRMSDALSVEPADPALRARIIASLPADASVAGKPFALRAAPALVALLVAIAMVAGLLYIGRQRPEPSLAWTGLHCRLPIANDVGWAPGFVSFPDGKFTPAPAGQSGTTYDAALDMWVPVPANQISPDGRRYATSGYITDVSTGKASPVPDIAGTILEWDTTGIYYRGGQGYTAWELWVYDPSSSQRRMISGAGEQSMEWALIGGGGAWGEPSGSYNKLVRLDLTTGEETVWYSDGDLSIIGADAQGHPVVMINSGVALGERRLILVVSPSKIVELGTVESPYLFFPVYVTGQSDAIWFSFGIQGIWLYTPKQGLHKLDFRATGINYPHVAGPCL